MASFLNKIFQKDKNENRPALLKYTVAGDNSKKKSLEILKSLSGNYEGSLISCIDETKTASGARLLKQRIIETTTNYVTSTAWSRLCGERWRVNIKNSWMNIQGKDRHHEWHCHPGYQVSGVYYMRVSPDQGGIQFLNPNNIIQSCNFPENTKTCPQSMEFIPCDGELILFPSWLMHNTCPNVTDEERISVAFNIDLEIE